MGGWRRWGIGGNVFGAVFGAEGGGEVVPGCDVELGAGWGFEFFGWEGGGSNGSWFDASLLLSLNRSAEGCGEGSEDGGVDLRWRWELKLG